jgi:signal transduction histidine kinase/ligand-binding sensor domain-containing protein
MKIAASVIACAALAGVTAARALNPTFDVNQYGHTAWRVDEGFAPGAIHDLAQTPDGYLWLATDSGLVRFDGVRTTAWEPPGNASLPDPHVQRLYVSRDGKLWMGTPRGYATWDGKEFAAHALDGQYVLGFTQDGEGTMWMLLGLMADATPRLCAVREERLQCEDDPLLRPWIAPPLADSRGDLWVANPMQVMRWRARAAAIYSLPFRVSGSVHPMAEAADGALLLATRGGIARVGDGKVSMLRMQLPSSFQASQLLRDREGSLWISGYEGDVAHFHDGRIDTFGTAGGLSGSVVHAMLEDREGNVWLATGEGIDRFRATNTAFYGRAQGLQGRVASLLADREGSLWVSTSAGLYRMDGGRFVAQRARGLMADTWGSLYQDRRGRLWLGSGQGLGYLEGDRFVAIPRFPQGQVDAIAQDEHGTIWVSHRNAGLVKVSAQGRVVQSTPWNRLGAASRGARLLGDPVNGGVWLALYPSGLLHLVDGDVSETYGSDVHIAGRTINSMRVASDGALWVASEGGLLRVHRGRVFAIDQQAGLPCTNIAASVADAEATWLYTACGVVRIEQGDMDKWSAAVDRSALAPRLRPTSFQLSEGSRGIVRSTASPGLARTADGRIWYTRINGVVAVDPRQLAINPIVPPVHVERVIVDRTAQSAASPLALPPLVRDLEIEYTALSLVAPESIQFRYRLEGRDREWVDAGNRRRAFYTDLPPGDYRFRVIAANNSGVWNEHGDTISFSIAPALWQTNAFRAGCVLALLLVGYGWHQWRLRHLAQRFRETLDARVNERLRIARDLHDTLLQSFHGLLLRFQTALQLWPTSEGQRVLERTIDAAADAVTEGRETVQGLRASATETNDLAESIRSLGVTLAAEHAGDAPDLRVRIEGRSRPLHPILRDEIFRIAGEALRNAFRHSGAARIEVEIHYDAREMRLRVRDDGRGIDAQVLAEGGRDKHFGVRGMRERAKLSGGRLAIWSAPGSGTEIEVMIPASHAYAGPAPKTEEVVTGEDD